MDTQVSNSQGVCKDCGNGTLNNETNPAFDYVYDERNDVDVLVCLRCRFIPRGRAVMRSLILSALCFLLSAINYTERWRS